MNNVFLYIFDIKAVTVYCNPTVRVILVFQNDESTISCCDDIFSLNCYYMVGDLSRRLPSICSHVDVLKAFFSSTLITTVHLCRQSFARFTICVNALDVDRHALNQNWLGSLVSISPSSLDLTKCSKTVRITLGSIMDM